MSTPLSFTSSRWVAAGIAALLLSACGGGNEIFPPPPPAPPPPPVTVVPDSAFASVQAYTAFALSLAPSDTDEPLTVPATDAPLSETDDPVPVN